MKGKTGLLQAVLLAALTIITACGGGGGSDPAPANNTTADTTAPTVPSGLLATAVSSTQINISWTASNDNTAVTGYKIYYSGTQLATSSTTSYLVSGLTASTQYCYKVSAYDTANNESAQSSQACATTTNANNDNVTILSITPSTVVSGQSTSFTVQVSYILQSNSSAKLQLAFNYNQVDSWQGTNAVGWVSTVSQGSGTATLTGITIPVTWGAAGNFGARVMLLDYLNTSGSSGITPILSTDTKSIIVTP